METMTAYTIIPKKKKRTKQQIDLNTVLVLIAIVAVSAVLMFRQLGFGRLSPSEVTFLWNAALYDGDIELAEQYTSETSVAYINDYFGSLTALSASYDDANRGTVRLIEERIDGDAAMVIYLTCYADGTQEETHSILRFEHGTWKIAPHYGQVRQVTGATC